MIPKDWPPNLLCNPFNNDSYKYSRKNSSLSKYFVLSSEDTLYVGFSTSSSTDVVIIEPNNGTGTLPGWIFNLHILLHYN